MKTSELLAGLKASVGEIPALKAIDEGFRHPHVKAWKTKLEDLLVGGGTTCHSALHTLRKIKSSLSGDAFIKKQTYLNQLSALERNVKQTIQCIQVLGRPEDKHQPPPWAKAKSQHLAIGHLMVGDEEISTDAINVHEVLACLISLAEDSNSLTSAMKCQIIEPLQAIMDDDLLQPFLNHKLAKLLGHWPEFSDSSANRT